MTATRRARRRRTEQGERVTSEVVNGKQSLFGEGFGDLKELDNPAYVRVNVRRTINLGNYESVQVGVDISMPCDPEPLKVAHMRKWVGDKVLKCLNAEISRMEGQL